MFTKSGKNIVRLSFPSKKAIPSPNACPQATIPINNSVNSALDEFKIRTLNGTLDEIRTSVPPLEPDFLLKIEKYEPPSETIEPVEATADKKNTLDQFVYSIRTDDSPVIPKQEQDVETPPKVTTWQSNTQTRSKAVAKEQVYTAPKAVSSFTVTPTKSKPRPKVVRKKIAITKPFQTNLPPDETNALEIKLSPNEKIKVESPPPSGHCTPTSEGKTSSTKTVYVLYTSTKNAVKRDRCIQAPDSPSKEIAVQCDFSEDADSSESESSEIDWKDEIIQECEFIEDNNLYECHVCGEVCTSNSAKYKHSLTHKDSSLLCFRCGGFFSDPTQLLAHEQKIHPDANAAVKKTLRCPKINCVKAFHSKVQLFEHIDQHSNRTSEQRCSRCQRLFQTPLQLLSHINRKICWR